MEIAVSNWILAIAYINHNLVIFIRIKSVHVGLGNSVHDGGLITLDFLLDTATNSRQPMTENMLKSIIVIRSE